MKFNGVEYIGKAIMGSVSPDEIDFVRKQTKIGETIKFFIDGNSEGGKGEVLRKYTHHALCKVGEHRESVCWIDVIRGMG